MSSVHQIDKRLPEPTASLRLASYHVWVKSRGTDGTAKQVSISEDAEEPVWAEVDGRQLLYYRSGRRWFVNDGRAVNL
jgi:hypothetical protein